MNRLYMNMKKAIMFLLVLLLVTTCFGFVQGVKTQENTVELIDQSSGGGGCGGCSGASTFLLTDGFYIAQSFEPSHNIISKIVLDLKKTGDPPLGMKLTLSIRETLDGDNLVSMEKEIDNVKMIFDIQDIDVVSGKMYYMIVMTNDVGTQNNGYGWYNTNENSYSRGSCWTSSNSVTWFEEEARDMFFVTYWKDYSPSQPNIEGPHNGAARERYDYTFSTTDPEADDVEYYIEWGDGMKSNWIGPYKSGEQVIKSHSWTYEGNYMIRVKARDVHGAVSDWTNIELTMPKNKVLINPFLRFLDNHPYLFYLLQYLLGLL